MRYGLELSAAGVCDPRTLAELRQEAEGVVPIGIKSEPISGRSPMPEPHGIWNPFPCLTLPRCERASSVAPCAVNDVQSRAPFW